MNCSSQYVAMMMMMSKTMSTAASDVQDVFSCVGAQIRT